MTHNSIKIFPSFHKSSSQVTANLFKTFCWFCLLHPSVSLSASTYLSVTFSTLLIYQPNCIKSLKFNLKKIKAVYIKCILLHLHPCSCLHLGSQINPNLLYIFCKSSIYNIVYIIFYSYNNLKVVTHEVEILLYEMHYKKLGR